jgi:hypothetical protein
VVTETFLSPLLILHQLPSQPSISILSLFRALTFHMLLNFSFVTFLSYLHVIRREKGVGKSNQFS